VRSGKSSDSPCSYCRDVYKTRGRVTTATVLQDFAAKLTRVNNSRARAGVPVPALEPVDDILRALEGLARAARLEGFESSLDAIGALAVAARLSHAHGEAVSFTSGDEAA
jgi:hypothetical protein